MKGTAASRLSRREFLGGASAVGAIVVICAEAAEAITAPPSAEAPARNLRRESPAPVVPFIFAPEFRIVGRKDKDDDSRTRTPNFAVLAIAGGRERRRCDVDAWRVKGQSVIIRGGRT